MSTTPGFIAAGIVAISLLALQGFVDAITVDGATTRTQIIEIKNELKELRSIAATALPEEQKERVIGVQRELESIVNEMEVE